ncbi:hypothetical protein [Rhizobium sp.]|uniref:hypothetical protein n=1 Tax=Rhizobium sp. TaxID=391 RepID=UPI0034C6D6B7
MAAPDGIHHFCVILMIDFDRFHHSCIEASKKSIYRSGIEDEALSRIAGGRDDDDNQA